MGGRVFPGLTRRYLAPEYFEIMPDIMDRVSMFADRFDVIPGYAKKESFGDMDVLYTPRIQLSQKYLQEIFQTENVSHNGSVWSLTFQELQVDLVLTTEIEYTYALNYFSWNDRGNLIGRYAHKMGLKHGHDCLKFPVRSNDTVLGEVILTHDPLQAEHFLDIEPVEELQTMEDIFVNVANSKYFNADIFLLDNRNHAARVRDAKRPTYTAFLKWCEQHIGQNPYEWNKDKSVYTDLIYAEFPHAQAQFEAIWDNKRYIDRANKKFNGTLVMEWTGLSGKPLGIAMKLLKEKLSTEVVLTLSESEIMKIVKHTMENKK